MRTCLPSRTQLGIRPKAKTRLGITCLAVAATLSLAMAGCSKSPVSSIVPTGSESHSTTAATTTAALKHVAVEPGTGDVLHGEGPVGGIPTRYSAYFEAAQLRRISEIRQLTGKGEYVFHGSRLIEYQGTAPGSAVDIELRFDPHGALVPPATGSIPPIDAMELNSIRTRAQLLRSLALARRSTETHTSQH